MTIASLAVAAVIVPVAIAYACNPQAHISLDKTSYQPGTAIGVHGSYFPGGAQITVTGPAGSSTVTASAGGGFQTTLSAPSSPGNYSITASRPTGGFAAASFSVVAPAAPAQAPQESAPARSEPAQSAPAAGTAPRFRTPEVARSQVTSTPDRGGSSGRSEGRSDSTGGGSGGGSGSGTAVVGGSPVFAGSAPVAAPAAAATAPASVPAVPVARSQRGESRATRSAAAGAAPAEQAAVSDLFSNYQPGRTPSLMGDASGAPAGGAGSGLGLGIALLGFGLLALVAGLTAAEARRRRPA